MPCGTLSIQLSAERVLSWQGRNSWLPPGRALCAATLGHHIDAFLQAQLLS